LTFTTVDVPITPAPLANPASRRYESGLEKNNGGTQMRTRKALTLATIICSLLITTSVLAADTSPAPITLKETVTSLGRVPEGWALEKRKLTASPDLAHVAYAARKGRQWMIKYVIMMDDTELARFESRGILQVVFSPNSKRVGCVAIGTDNDHFVVVDGTMGPHYGYIGVRNFRFTPDSKSFAYTVSKGPRDAIVVDNKELRPTHPMLGEIAHSPDSAHFAYMLSPGSIFWGMEKWYVVLDGRRLRAPSYEYARDLTFSPDSKRLAYVVSDDTLIVDRKAHPRYNLVTDITFSPDSRRLMYVANTGRGGHGSCVVIDGVEGPSYKYITSLPVFSPDSSHVAYSALKSEKGCVVMDGSEGKDYDHTMLPVFSPDSNHLGYGAKNDGRAFMVLDGKEGQGYDKVWQPAFSPDSAHFAYVAEEEGQAFLVVDGVEATTRFSSSVASLPQDWRKSMPEDNMKRLKFTSPTTVQGIFRRDPGPEFLRLEVQILPAPENQEAE
jgi:hypothetical protein